MGLTGVLMRHNSLAKNHSLNQPESIILVEKMEVIYNGSHSYDTRDL